MLSSVLIGTWVFTNLIQESPTHIAPPSEGLVMTLEFKEDGTNVLHYYKKGDNTFCKRTAQFEYKDGLLNQKVLDVDPQNAPFCIEDPDMQSEKETLTPLELQENLMLMTLTLGEDKLIYEWKPCDDNTPGKTCEEVALPSQPPPKP